MNSSLRVVALAMLGSLAGLVLAWSLGGLPRAGAQVFLVTPAGGGQLGSGGNLRIVVSAQDDAGDLIITATGATNPMLTVVSCTGPQIINCTGAVSGEGTSSITIKTDILNVPEEVIDPILVVVNLTATCASFAPITVSATQGKEGTVLAVPAVLCQPDTTPKFAGSSSVSSVGCGGEAIVTFGPIVAVAAQTLDFTTSVGTLSPASVAYIGSGAVTTTFNAPVTPFSGSAIISVQDRSGMVLGRVRVTVNCLAATATVPASPTAAAQPAGTATPATRAGIVPPSTGDGGLIPSTPARSAAMAAWVPAAFLALGALGLAWRRE